MWWWDGQMQARDDPTSDKITNLDQAGAGPGNIKHENESPITHVPFWKTRMIKLSLYSKIS